MILAIFALLVIIGLVGLLGSYSLVGGATLIILICALMAFGINRIRRTRVD